MNKASIIRYGATTALGLTMFGALLSAATMNDRASDRDAANEISQRIAIDSAEALQTVDLSLSALAQALAVSAPANGGAIPEAEFRALSSRFFSLTDDTQALAFFRTVADRETAMRIASATAEGIAQFTDANGTLYLAASRVAGDRRIDGSTLVFAGDGGKLPMALVSGAEARERMGQALNFDLPLSSDLFRATPAGIAAIDSGALGSLGETGFWRMVSVRGIDAEGRARPIGVLAAFVDAKALFGNPIAPRMKVSGPHTGGARPSTAIQDGWQEITVPSGNQSFAVAFPEQRTPLSLAGWVVAILGGVIAAGTAFFAMASENNGRMEAERRLALHKREFKKRTQELKRSEDRFRRLAESTNVIPWAADLREGRFTYIGPQIERLCGYPAQSWRAKGFWNDHVHPEDRRPFADRISRLAGGSHATLEYRVRSADGRVVYMRNMMTIIESRTKSGEKVLVAQGYMLDITEMKTAQNTLTEARRGAEQANKTKSEFLANMSHELRTPLNSVIGFAEVMKDEVFGPMGERYREYAESVHSSGQHLLSLINDVLDLSKIEAGKIELVEEETDLSVILSKCRQLLHERASQAGLHIRLEIPAPLPFVLVDGRRIKQVVLNLMSNSVKFTPPGGRITLRAELLAPQGLKVSVNDTGIGMSKEEVDVALEQFGQIDSELSRQHEGTGLGLPIARSLAELHGGSLTVESKKDAGTSVSLWIPMSRVLAGKGEKVA